MAYLLAYIDPGSGSLIIQAIVATVVAVPFFFRHHIGRLVRTVRGRDRADAGTAGGSKENDSGESAH